jgi:hypothetical protein
MALSSRLDDRSIGDRPERALRSYNQGGDFPTLLALIIAVGFPLLLLSLVFDIFPRDRVAQMVAELRLPVSLAEARPSASPAPIPPTPPPLRLASADWTIPNGHFFTQMNGEESLTSARGYAVTNDRGMAFWDEYQKLGGVNVVGYPVSNRFPWRGFTVQVFQKLVFQAPEVGGEVQIINLLDELSAAGKDQLLRGDFTPPPLGPEIDAGKSPEEAAAARLELLKEDPAIESFYREAKDPLRRFGLPTSKATDMGPDVVAMRFQRAVLQRWKKDMPWAKAGQVTIANAGELAVKADFFPKEQLQPTVSAPPATAGASPAPSPSTR